LQAELALDMKREAPCYEHGASNDVRWTIAITDLESVAIGHCVTYPEEGGYVVARAKSAGMENSGDRSSFYFCIAVLGLCAILGLVVIFVTAISRGMDAKASYSQEQSTLEFRRNP
jgi:hypothetical protein